MNSKIKAPDYRYVYIGGVGIGSQCSDPNVNALGVAPSRHFSSMEIIQAGRTPCLIKNVDIMEIAGPLGPVETTLMPKWI